MRSISNKRYRVIATVMDAGMLTNATTKSKPPTALCEASDATSRTNIPATITVE
jgi:hypothetical protein